MTKLTPTQGRCLSYIHAYTEGFGYPPAESEQRLVNDRQRRKKLKAEAEANEDWPPYDSAFEAYLAGDFAALYALEQDAQDGR